MHDVLLACAVSFAVVFVAELGDKSQLMALTFATRYRIWPVLFGITLATSLVHLVSVVVGSGLGAALPTGWIAVVAALAFFGFGVWTLRGDSLSEEEQNKVNRRVRSVIAAVTVSFFLAELGDKTMLATITLATQYGWFGVWLGSTLGMVAADALAIVVGRQLGRRLPEDVIRYGAAALFAAFGVALLVDGTEQVTGGTAAFDHHLAGWIALALGLGAVLAGAFGRRWARAGSRRSPIRSGLGTPDWWSQLLFALALVLGLGAPLLVAFDVLQPIPLFSTPAYAAVGAGVVLLGVALLLAALVQVGSARRRGDGGELARRGLYSRVRNPALTGLITAMAGVLATVLIVIALQIQVRAVREPGLSEALGEEYADYVARTGRFLPRLRVTAGRTAPERPATRTRRTPARRVRVG